MSQTLFKSLFLHKSIQIPLSVHWIQGVQSVYIYKSFVNNKTFILSSPVLKPIHARFQEQGRKHPGDQTQNLSSSKHLILFLHFLPYPNTNHGKNLYNDEAVGGSCLVQSALIGARLDPVCSCVPNLPDI